MKLQFLGATTTVTGSEFLLTTEQARVLVDCGMFQGAPHETAHNRSPFAYDPAGLDAVVLTHAHLDHCGRIPLLAKHGFTGPVYATGATAELARLVLLDSGGLQEEHAEVARERARRHAARNGPAAAQRDDAAVDTEEAIRSQPPHLETGIAEPLYTEADARACLSLFHGVRYDEPIEVAPGVQVILRDAGHILGSAIVEMQVRDARGEVRRLVFSGDLGRPHAPIIRDPTIIGAGADDVVVESTYGGRRHEPEAESRQLLAEAVRLVAERGGVLLIPAFAIGRTQELVWTLDRLLEADEIPHLPLYLDSPMASHASEVYRAFPGYYDEETHRLLAEGETPLDYPGQVVTRTAEASKSIRRAHRPLIVVSSNGMLTGGRVVHHLNDIIDDPRSVLLFVGYQGEGTLGHHLQSGAREVRINGNWRPVRCEIRTIGGYSAHADEPELLDWLAHFASAAHRPGRVFVIHGDPEAAAAVARGIEGLGLTPYRPAWRETVELD